MRVARGDDAAPPGAPWSAVIVTPSVYGTDNSATLYGMRARGADARGVAVIDDATPDSQLDAMGQAGIRGIRLNLATVDVTDPAVGRQRLRAAVERVRRRWHVQLYTSPGMIAAIKDLVAASPVPVVFDHFGGARAEHGLAAASPTCCELVRRAGLRQDLRRLSRLVARADYGDVVPLARALIGANPDRIVWGTDWPHPDARTRPGGKPTDVTPLLHIDDGRVFNQLPVWAPDPAIRQRILVTNPSRLYGF